MLQSFSSCEGQIQVKRERCSSVLRVSERNAATNSGSRRTTKQSLAMTIADSKCTWEVDRKFNRAREVIADAFYAKQSSSRQAESSARRYWQ